MEANGICGRLATHRSHASSGTMRPCKSRRCPLTRRILKSPPSDDVSDSRPSQWQPCTACRESPGNLQRDSSSASSLPSLLLLSTGHAARGRVTANAHPPGREPSKGSWRSDNISIPGDLQFVSGMTASGRRPGAARRSAQPMHEQIGHTHRRGPVEGSGPVRGTPRKSAQMF
jgi:hypothetical protein